jgi:hypothetical protein
MLTVPAASGLYQLADRPPQGDESGSPPHYRLHKLSIPYWLDVGPSAIYLGCMGEQR